MHNAGLVGSRETREYGFHHVERLLGCQFAVLLQQITQVDAGKVFHDQVGGIAVLPLVENVDNVGVGEARGRACFLDEAFLEGAVLGKVVVHHLDSHSALESQVGREINSGHAATRNARANLVPAVYQTADHRVSAIRVHRSIVVSARGFPRRNTAAGRFTSAPGTRRGRKSPIWRRRRGTPRSEPFVRRRSPRGIPIPKSRADQR